MKKLLYAVIGIGVLYIILCFFGPSDLKVERSVVVKTEESKTLRSLADLKFFHDEWSPWTKKDPGMKTSYEGECCQPGYKYSWESDKEDVGKGSMTFNGFSGDSVLMTLHFEGMGDSKVYYITDATENGVKITWGMEMKMGFFGRAPMLFMNMDKMIGPDFEEGLNALKTKLESEPAEVKVDYAIEETEFGSKKYIGVKAIKKFNEISTFCGDNFPKLYEYCVKNKLAFTGAMSTIYFTYDEAGEKTELAVVVPIEDASKVKGWEVFDIPKSKALLINYYGRYDKIGDAHYAMSAYLGQKNIIPGIAIEEYITDPGSEPDTSKWLTKIYYLSSK